MSQRNITKQESSSFIYGKEVPKKIKRLIDIICNKESMETLELYLKNNKDISLNQLYDVKLHSGKTGSKAASHLTPLYVAFATQNWKAAGLLLKNGADPDMNCSPSSQFRSSNALQYFILLASEITVSEPQAKAFKKDCNEILLLLLNANANFRNSRVVSNLYLLCTFATIIEPSFFIRLIVKMGKENFKRWVNEDPISVPTAELSPTERAGAAGERYAPLMVLCIERQVTLVDLFLQAGANPNVRLRSSATALLVCLEDLVGLTAGPISPADEERRKAIQDCRSMIDLLIKHSGEGIKNTFTKNATLLHILAEYNNEEYTRRFCRLGLDINAKDVAGSTPAHLAAMRGNMAALRVLVDEFNCDLTSHTTAFRFKVTPSTSSQLRDSAFTLTDIIDTPLICAFRMQQAEAVRYLYAKLPNKDDDNFMRFLSVALPQMKEKAKVFLEQVPELNQFLQQRTLQNVGLTCDQLEYLISLGKTELVIAELHTLQVSLSELARLVVIALHYQEKSIVACLLKKYKEEITLLLKANGTYAFAAIQLASDLELLNLMLEQGASIFSDHVDQSPIHAAAESNNVPALSAMFRYFPQGFDHLADEESPLVRAAMNESKEACDFLLAIGANPLAYSKTEDLTPLLIFVQNNDIDRVQMIFERSPSLDLSSSTSLPYLAAAARNKNAAMFVTLFNHGARDLNIFTYGKKDSAFASVKRAKDWIDDLKEASIHTWFIQEARRREAQISKDSERTSGFIETGTTFSPRGKKMDKPREKEIPEQQTSELSLPPIISFFPTPTPIDSFTWFKLISSQDAAVVPIDGGVRCFLYLDKALLAKQGCNEALIERAYETASLNGKKIKKLTLLNINCSIQMNGVTLASNFEFEIRFPSTKARILLCPVRDEANKATLLIGCQYLENGLHQVKDIRSLRESYQHKSLIELSHDGREASLSGMADQKKLFTSQ